jgi:small subunit ribosomal protein S4
MIQKPQFKVCRRLGPGVYDKCQTPKFKVVAKKFTPGGRPPKALSEYGTQLIEKQKVRFSYGITERQLSNYVKKIPRAKGINPIDKFYETLESRLDNVVYRMGIANSRRAARQMVSHGHFMVNGHRVTIPSYLVKVRDIVKVREGSKGKKVFSGIVEKIKNYKFPAWLSFDTNIMEGKIISVPKNTETFLNFGVVFEFYSR